MCPTSDLNSRSLNLGKFYKIYLLQSSQYRWRKVGLTSLLGLFVEDNIKGDKEWRLYTVVGEVGSKRLGIVSSKDVRRELRPGVVEGRTDLVGTHDCR